MRNHWMNHKTLKFISTDRFNEALNEYFDKGDLHATMELRHCFSVLSGNIIKFSSFDAVPSYEASDEMINFCMNKADKIHKKWPKFRCEMRYQAFNYFTTLMLNKLRSIYRKAKGLND